MINEYLISFKLNEMEKEYTDVLIIGSGIAGLYTALNINDNVNVTILTKEVIEECNTYKAQGGVAAAVAKGDKPEYHFEDTLKSGVGICDNEAVRVLTDEAPENIYNLMKKAEFSFERDKNGDLALGLEGAHSYRRIVRYKDFTGKYIEENLKKAVLKKSNITVKESITAIDLIHRRDGEQNNVYGALIIENENMKAIIAKKVILASGGVGMMYRNSTNSYIATADGMAMALRAGATMKDMEFVQFHPTGFRTKMGTCFLISEAVRGDGGILRNNKGEAFMEKYHPLKELATRDIVARAILSEMQKANSENVYLDITAMPKEELQDRFEQIYGTLIEDGIDMSKDFIPVSPVQHYFMGGVQVDTYGRTSVNNLYALGECSCTGIHGANRLASNSLLEGLVFGRRAAGDINNLNVKEVDFWDENVLNISYDTTKKPFDESLGELTTKLKSVCENYIGPLRDEDGLKKAISYLESKIKDMGQWEPVERNEIELINMYQIAYIIATAAELRKESRGGHYRNDYSDRNDNEFKCNITFKLVGGELISDKLFNN